MSSKSGSWCVASVTSRITDIASVSDLILKVNDVAALLRATDVQCLASARNAAALCEDLGQWATIWVRSPCSRRWQLGLSFLPLPS